VGGRTRAILFGAIVLAGLATPAPAAAAAPFASIASGTSPLQIASSSSNVGRSSPVQIAIGAGMWQWQNPLPNGDTVYGMSCPATDNCFATQTNGAILHTSDGTHWSQQASVAAAMVGMSCSDSSHCSAVGLTGSTGCATSTADGNNWSALQCSSTGKSLLAVSCPTSTACFAVGAGGWIYQNTNPTVGWQTHASPTMADLYGVSCPSANVCFAAGLTGVVIATTDGGVTWTVSAAGNGSPGDLFAISCPTTSMCMAVGRAGIGFETINGGALWTQVANNAVSFDAVSCPDASHCFATGADGDVYLLLIQTPTPFVTTGAAGALYGISCTSIARCYAGGEFATVVRTTNGGTGWSNQTSGTKNDLVGVSCPITTTCFAVGNDLTTHAGFVLGTVDGGSTWPAQPAAATAAAGATLNAVSCPTAPVCVAVGANATAINTADGGASWTSRVSGTTFNLNAVSCASSAVCFAAGSGGAIVKSMDGGNTWSPQTSGTTQSISGISCPTTSVCFAAGYVNVPGQIISTTDGGAHWNLSFDLTTDPNAGVSAPFQAISCPSALYCYASGQSGLVAATSDGGNNWRTDNTPFAGAFSAISCPTTGECVAGATTEIAQTTAFGRTWNMEFLSAGGTYWNGASCADTSTCILVGTQGAIGRTTVGGAAWSLVMPGSATGNVHGLVCADVNNCYATATDTLLSTHDGGATWTAHNVASTDLLVSISCPVASTCYAVGWPGAVYKTSDGGTSWTYVNTAVSGQDVSLAGVSCAGLLTCVAVGSNGAILSTTDGTSWALGPLITPHFLDAVTCASTSSCVAVGGGGTVLTKSGISWTHASSGTTKELRGVDCPSTTVCYAVASGGAVLKSANGGATWSAQTSGTSQDLDAVRCVQTTVCLAVGSAGTAILTLDGTNWADDSPLTNDGLNSVAWADLNNAWIGGEGGTILVNNEVTSACGSISGGPQPASPTTVGTVVTISATANACHNPLYEFWMLPPGGTWTLAQGWSSSSVFSWNSSNAVAGSYRFSVWARDLSSTSSYDSFFAFQYTLTVTACSGISVTGAPSSTSVQRGQPVQFTATSTGCPNPRYEFWLLPPGGSWSLAQAYSPNASYNWSTFVPVGTYRFSVWVRDASSTNPYDAFSAFPYTIAGTACTSVSASTNPPNTATLGTPVTITGSATGCPYASYEFWLRPPGGSWKLVQPYSSTLSTYNWSTGWLAPGTYRFSVWAQDGTSPTSYQAFSAFDYTLTGSSCGVATSSSPNGTAAAGTTVTISASTPGCPMSNFEFWLLPPGGAWMLAQSYSANAAFTWNTLGGAPGVYRFSVWARDPTSSAAYDAFNAFNYMLTVAPCTAMSATAAPPSSATVGTAVAITASATGCPNALYEFWMLAPGGTWTLVQAYSTTATFTWNTAGTAAGSYRFSVWARDASSSASYDAFSAFNYALT
jgi:photosystem II stability/assembly factor-like uncharacterized protein